MSISPFTSGSTAMTSKLVLTDDSLNSTTGSIHISTEEEVSSKKYVFWNVTQLKTSYPQLVLPELDLITDDGSNSESETEENSVQREKYSSKVDQDVAVFMMIAEKLSVTSLVHLLQGHVRSQQNHTWHYDTIYAMEQEKERKKLIQVEESSSSSSLASNSTEDSLQDVRPTKKRRKSFRFATIWNGDVRAVVHEFERISTEDMNDIWWNGNEMMSFRCNAIETVRHYRKHRKKYIEAIESVVIHSGGSSSSTGSSTTVDESHSDNDRTNDTASGKKVAQNKRNGMSSVVENAIKVLTVDSFARGLETHICTVLSRSRTEMIEALLEEQVECRKCHDSYTVSAEALRGQSLAYSTSSVQFAIALGQVDHIEALKAAMSVWTPEI